MNRVTALVPMKGHSERIPGKNMKPLCGKPLCFYIIDTLMNVSAVECIVINTDSSELADLVKRQFAQSTKPILIHERPREIQGDFVPMNQIIAFDLQKLSSTEHFVQTHSTNPLLKAATLEAAIEEYFVGLHGPKPHDSLFSVTRHQARFYDRNLAPINHNPAELLRTQDLPPVYEENSNFYIFSQSSFKKRGQRIGERPAVLPMDPLEATDIDDGPQWRLAQALLNSQP